MMAAHRDFEMVCDGGTGRELSAHCDFLMLLEEAVVYSLENRGLLTESQRKECIALLEKRQKKSLRSPGKE